ncbi:hypothetical protein KSB_09880 [Ktedonobacter robiniae]|uniref:Uncharacterized protein n=1 Tax=Ktedonobacter robiniae TaxID=2778365 RepID=A0ABQ3UII0_9CHLR|nr:hypothetical protein KSB_09880 [Ktedonobacter robiniae]
MLDTLMGQFLPELGEVFFNLFCSYAFAPEHTRSMCNVYYRRLSQFMACHLFWSQPARVIHATIFGSDNSPRM